MASDSGEAPARLEAAILTFPHVERAEEVFGEVRERVGDAPWTDELGFVERHHNGRVFMRGTFAGHYLDVDPEGDLIGRDTAVGALTGALLGLALGPPGFAVGLVVGGTVGGVIESRHVPEEHGALLDEIRAAVPDDSSAIVLLAAPEHVDAMAQAFAGSGGRLIRHPLSDEAAAALEAALASAPPAPDAAAPVVDVGTEGPPAAAGFERSEGFEGFEGFEG